MDYYLFVVEGTHDATFFGRLLQERGFQKLTKMGQVNLFWHRCIPKIFPVDGDKLEHVLTYPHFYGRDDSSVAIAISNGDSKLMSELRTSLDMVNVRQLRGIAVAIDADDKTAAERFKYLIRQLTKVNEKSVADNVAGMPLTLPSRPGEIAEGTPRVGVYVFPDNSSIGTLETLLLECAATSYKSLQGPAETFIADLDRSLPAASVELSLLRKGSGRQKAAAGIIGNLVMPGSHLSVAVDRGSWFQPLCGREVGVAASRKFLDEFFT
jgi:hypothetical protein